MLSAGLFVPDHRPFLRPGSPGARLRADEPGHPAAHPVGRRPRRAGQGGRPAADSDRRLRAHRGDAEEARDRHRAGARLIRPLARGPSRTGPRARLLNCGRGQRERPPSVDRARPDRRGSRPDDLRRQAGARTSRKRSPASGRPPRAAPRSCACRSSSARSTSARRKTRRCSRWPSRSPARRPRRSRRSRSKHKVVVVGVALRAACRRRSTTTPRSSSIATARSSGKYRKMHIPDDPLYYEKFYFTPGDLGFKAHDTAPAGWACWCAGISGSRKARG